MERRDKTTVVPVELLKKYDRPGPRYTSYPTAPVWSEEIGSTDYVDALGRASQAVDQPLALYCHIPFCKTRCYYCGCNTVITRNSDSINEYVRIMELEINRTADQLGDRKNVTQLHFGGGTPTFVGAEGLGRILDILEQRFDFAAKCEKSIEVDPRVTTMEQLDYLAGRGFNRASLGVQDLDAEVQRASGRPQPIEDVIAVQEKCRELNFRGINFDLIYGLPLQTVPQFSQTLDRIIELRPDRLAVYSFAYLPSMKAHQSKINEHDLPSTDSKYALFAVAIEKLTAAGYRQIGMDHFALPEDELSLAQADGRLHRNFMGYTVQSAPEMIGFGMSSIGYVNDAFFQNFSKITSYKERVEADGFAIYRGMRLSQDDLVRQYLITSLMCNFSLDYGQLQERFGVDYHEYFSSAYLGLEEFIADGFIEVGEKRLTITQLGRTFVRNIAMVYDAYLKDQGQTRYSRTI